CQSLSTSGPLIVGTPAGNSAARSLPSRSCAVSRSSSLPAVRPGAAVVALSAAISLSFWIATPAETSSRQNKSSSISSASVKPSTTPRRCPRSPSATVSPLKLIGSGSLAVVARDRSLRLRRAGGHAEKPPPERCLRPEPPLPAEALGGELARLPDRHQRRIDGPQGRDRLGKLGLNLLARPGRRCR